MNINSNSNGHGSMSGDTNILAENDQPAKGDLAIGETCPTLSNKGNQNSTLKLLLSTQTSESTIEKFTLGNESGAGKFHSKIFKRLEHSEAQLNNPPLIEAKFLSCGNSKIRTKHLSPAIERGLKGTTIVAFIGTTAIHLASDQRGVRTSNQGGVLLTYVSTDEWTKLYNIDNDILCSAAGYSERCIEFAQAAININRVAFRGVPAPERVYLAARVVMACMDNWEMTHPGLPCQEEFIIAGCYCAQALVFRVRSNTLGGIVYGTGVGYSVIIGSGRTHAAEFVEAHRNNLQHHTLVESAIVVASVKEKSTGGRVQRAKIPIGRNQAAIFCDPPLSVMQLLERDLNRYRQHLEKSFFFVCYYFLYNHEEFVCHDFPYNEESEPILLRALAGRFPNSSIHVISRRNQVIRIITFDNDWSFSEARNLPTDGIHWEIGPQHSISLMFFKPTEEHIRILREEEQGVV